MFDCSKDVRAFHDQKITLPQSERTAMRDRRDTNRRRLRKGLEANGDPLPEESVSQGSYAMRTMLADADNDYDIDDGAYYDEADLAWADGTEMAPVEAREMVRSALDDGSFDRAPEARENCVRIYYKKGFHVDIPVYRRAERDDESVYELASGTNWVRSDARDVTAWFDRERTASGDGDQLRRIVREMKKFARSRPSWRGKILSGFAITALVAERGCIDVREDRALHDTIEAVRDRLNDDLTIEHPVTPATDITQGSADPKAIALRDRLSEALRWLEPLHDDECTREEALSCWDKVFDTTFFSERAGVGENPGSPAKAVTTSAALIGLESATAASVRDAGGGRHA